MENSKVPDILTQVSKEKFRRKVMIGSRIIAIALVFAIFWIGYIQISYVKEFNDMRAEYGPHAYCYYCGLESGKSCTCNFIQPEQFEQGIDREEWLKEIAEGNIQSCNDFERNDYLNIDLDKIETTD